MNKYAFTNRFYNKDLYPMDAFYGPWNSFDDLYNEFVEDGDKEDLPYDDFVSALNKGIVVGIIENGEIVEYWKKSDDSGFVKKSSDDEIYAYIDKIKQELINLINGESEDSESEIGTCKIQATYNNN